MSSKGPHTRGRGGGKLDESTGTSNWRDVASLAPEPSTQWQAGTKECPKDYNADAFVNRACGPILVRTPNVLGAGTLSRIRPLLQSEHTRTRRGRPAVRLAHTRSPRRCLWRGGRSTEEGLLCLNLEPSSPSPRQKHCYELLQGNPMISCHQRYAAVTGVWYF